MLLLKALRRKLFPNNNERGPVECHFGDSTYATVGCKTIVKPGEGVMYGGQTFCTEAHAALDQEDSWP